MTDYYIEVDEETFYKFLKDYPREYEADRCGIVFPDMLLYYDFSQPNDVEAIAAKTYDFKDMEHYKDPYDIYGISKYWYKKWQNNEL